MPDRWDEEARSLVEESCGAVVAALSIPERVFLSHVVAALARRAVESLEPLRLAAEEHERDHRAESPVYSDLCSLCQAVRSLAGAKRDHGG